MIYSHSRLSTFEQCPLKFKFMYLDKVSPSEEEAIETFLGSMVHEALEWLYKHVMMTNIPTEEELLEDFEHRWKKNFHARIKISKKEFKEEHYFERGKKFLKSYYRRYKPFKENTIAVEKWVVVKLDKEGKYKLHGYIDRLVFNEKEKAYEVHDYKTQKELSEIEDLEHDRQLTLYSLGVKDMYPDANKICLVWHFLAFDKEFCIYRTKKQLEKLKQDTIKLIQKIEKTKDFPALKSALCNWCEYQELCPNYKHKAELDKKTVNEYLKDDGVKLVNKYAGLKQREKEFLDKLNKEMEQLKEAIIQYAKKKKIEVLFGSNNKVSVKFSKHFKFPTKGSEERKELDSLLKKLKKWDEVATLDTFALEKEMEEGKWSKEIIKKIKKFGKEEESSSVRLSKLKEEEE